MQIIMLLFIAILPDFQIIIWCETLVSINQVGKHYCKANNLLYLHAYLVGEYGRTKYREGITKEH